MFEQLEQLKQEVYKGDNIAIVCDLMISSAVEMEASDIHIEPLENVVRLRYRIDGELREILEYQKFLHAQIIARYKILSNLKIDESRMPQDGRISTEITGKQVDLRVSTLPTVSWEKVCMRIVDKTKKVPELKVLGFEWHNKKILEKAITQPTGIVLTSGPTGSGKSTTLYSCISDLNKPDINIMTLEDPVENVLDGINQSQTYPLIGYTFASGLRTALRQDPDIIMVGEIRDKETIDIAIEASLTGHLVLSTIHTNSAAETVTRILNMGVQPFLLPASVNAIIAQRLIRRLCPNCKQKIAMSELDDLTKKMIHNSLSKTSREEIQERVSEKLLKNPEFYQPKGCEKCYNTGYKGRLGIYEVLDITLDIKKAILRGASGGELHDIAMQWGMISLEQDGLIKALNWQTSLAEVYSAVREN